MYELLLLLQTNGGGWTTQADVFEEIFFVFLALGTLVGVVVMGYTMYNAYKYRDTGSYEDEKSTFEPPVLGELPTGQKGGKGKKLFLSFGLSAVLVISLVVYSYGLLLYVEDGPSQDVESEMEIEVEGYQFGWDFIYPNGHTATNELRVPVDTVIQLQVTSRDVWHNFGSPELRIKADAIPGEYQDRWFNAEETGEHHAECFELCGAGHSGMTATIIVMEEEEFNDWYENAGSEEESSDEEGNGDEETSGDEEANGDEETNGDETDDQGNDSESEGEEGDN